MSDDIDWLKSAKRKVESMSEEVLAVREQALNDLNYFAHLMNKGYVYGGIHQEVYRWLQDYTLYGQEEASQNKLIMLPRAHLKSHMVATAAAWLITRHPEITILYISATSELAEKQLYAIKQILTSKVYTRFFPEYVHPLEGKRERWNNSKISIDHPKRKEEGIRDETIATAGLTTNTTGWHADLIVADDLVVPDNAYTEAGREMVVKMSSQFTSIRNAGGFTLACGTRYHPKDIYDTWKKQFVETYNDDGEVTGKAPIWDVKEYAVEQDGVFIWPRTMRPSDGKFFGFDIRTLARIRGEYEDTTQFYAQYYNNPNDVGSNRISRDKFQYYDKKYLKMEDGDWHFKGNRLNIYASIDFAYAYSKKADYTAVVVIGIDQDNQIYILDIQRFRAGRVSEYFKELALMHSKWGFLKLRAEVTAAQEVIVRDLKDMLKREGLRLSVEEFRPSKKEGTKEERISSILEHRYDNLTMWHYQGGFTDALEEELVLARPPHDDMKDALASAVAIAVKPKSGSSRRNINKRPIYASRFGGVSFRG